MNDINAIDSSVINTLKGLMKDRFGFLIETFLSKTQTQLDDLKIAIANNKTDDIISITHGMKGSAGSVGASSIHLLCKDYEDSARNNKLDGIETWVDLLQTEYERYKTEIQAHL